jgi:hypothetical protein
MLLRVDELLVLGNDSAAFHPCDAHLDDAVAELGAGARCLHIDDCQRHGMQRIQQRQRHVRGILAAAPPDVVGGAR